MTRKEFNEPNTLIIGLINYWDFIGQPDDLLKIDPLIPNTNKIYLSNEDFSILIEALPNIEEKIETLKSVGGHAITHLVKIQKENGDNFSSENEAHEIINDFIDFISFSSGSWVTPVYEIGYSNKQNKEWECWRVGKSHPWKFTLGWTDEHNARNTLPKAFPLFMKSYNSSSRSVITSVINWYLLSNIQTVIDGSLVLANIALESLAWSQLVDKGKLSKDGFNRLDKSDLFRLLISGCGIPTSIPDELPGLQRIGKELNFDGPELVVQKRNSTVHPTHSKKEKLSSITFGTWNLCMWYLELVILSIIGYDGKYYKRLKISGWKGEKEIVPWAEDSSI